MQYLDTSLLVTALTNEPRSIPVQIWLGEQDLDGLTISDRVLAEFSAALSIKVRSGQIEASHRSRSLSRFIRYAAESLSGVPIVRAHFRTAARFADQYSLELRAGDGLHLAVAADLNATLCTLDRRLAEAGTALGLSTELL